MRRIVQAAMTSGDVAAFYREMEALGIEVWLDGGWGVDALLGRQTRAHADLDLVVQEKDLGRLVELLKGRGFRKLPRDDSRAWNFVMGDGRGKEIDLHVIAIDRAGNGIYGPPERGEGMYPAAALQGEGQIGGLSVRCVSANFQMQSHAGYEPDETDYRDVRALAVAFGLEIPKCYDKWLGQEHRGEEAMKGTKADAAAERERAVAACIGDVKAIIAEEGVTRDALERVKGRLLELAKRRDLFSFEQLPPNDRGSTLHLLSEDDDHGFALYAVAAHSASRTPPHDHTTWAVVVGVEGKETNRLWRRLDDGAVPGEARLEPIDETVVEPGTGVALMPDDIHSIERAGDAPMLHFHLYGCSIEHLPQRRKFDLERGSYEVYPANPNIVR